MNTRLKQFLSAENISQSQFADAIKVVRASVSHVLSGRNNPGYDFIKAIMLAYPNLNIEWLMLGKGKMYKETYDNKTLFHDVDEAEKIISGPEYQEELVETAVIEPKNQIVVEEKVAENILPKSYAQRKVKKVIIFFDDDTYQEM